MRDSTQGKAWQALLRSSSSEQTQAPEMNCCLLMSAFSCKDSALGIFERPATSRQPGCKSKAAC